MNINCAKSIIAIVACLGAVVAHAAVEFSGIVSIGGSSRFSLTDLSTGKASEFLEIGQAFAGVKIEKYDEARQMLTVAGSEGSIELPLKLDRVRHKEAERANSKAVTIGISADGKFVVNGQSFDLSGMQAQMKELAKTIPDPAFDVRFAPEYTGPVEQSLKDLKKTLPTIFKKFTMDFQPARSAK